MYFIDPITPTTGGLSGMFFLRYGRDITVRNWTEYARLRDHNVSYVYYFDEARRPREILADKNAVPLVAPSLPLDFAVPIRLEGLEVAGTNIPRGSPAVLILYWRGLDKIDRNYTVFVHLLDREVDVIPGFGSTLAAEDRLLAQLDADPNRPAACCLKLLAYTGMRRGEALGLRQQRHHAVTPVQVVERAG